MAWHDHHFRHSVRESEIDSDERHNCCLQLEIVTLFLSFQSNEEAPSLTFGPCTHPKCPLFILLVPTLTVWLVYNSRIDNEEMEIESNLEEGKRTSDAFTLSGTKS
jgi:hypothetical protein